MPPESPKYKRGDKVVALGLKLNGEPYNVHGTYMQACPHKDYKGRHVVVVMETEITVADKDLMLETEYAKLNT